MIKVGLTGGIGSGKTFVSNYFSKLGIAIYNSDQQAKYLMENNADVKDKLIKAFGTNCFTQDGLNRKYLAQLVFNNQNYLQTINQIVHPAVKTDFENWCKMQSGRYIIKEAAILIESGAYKTLDKLIVVTAPIQMRIDRVAKRDNMSKAEIETRIANQMTDHERIKYANFIINNDGTKLVETEVNKINTELLSA